MGRRHNVKPVWDEKGVLALGSNPASEAPAPFASGTLSQRGSSLISGIY